MNSTARLIIIVGFALGALLNGASSVLRMRAGDARGSWLSACYAVACAAVIVGAL